MVMKKEFFWAIFSVLMVALVWSCNQLPAPNDQQNNTSKESQEELLRKVDELRKENEELERKIEKDKNKPADEDVVAPEPTEIALKIVKAIKKFDANFKPIVELKLQNNARKTINTAEVLVDFSYASSETSSNCQFQKSIPLKLSPNTTKSVVLVIPAGYDKKCSDNAKVTVQKITYSDGSTEEF